MELETLLPGRYSDPGLLILSIVTREHLLNLSRLASRRLDSRSVPD